MNTEFLTEAYIKSRIRLRAIAGRILGDNGSADDMLQEAFVRLWQRRERITTESHAEGMLAVTVRNLSIDHFRESHHGQFTSIDEAEDKAEETDHDTDEAVKRVEEAICRILSVRDREILYRRERDGWEMEEIAGYYGLTEVNVRSIISRGRKAVKNYLTTRADD